jgi:hypothetical protein
MKNLENIYQENFELAYHWRAALLVTYPIEFLCLSAAKLMVLDRMAVFAAGEVVRTRQQLAVAGRVMMAVVVTGNAVGLGANVAAAVHHEKAAALAASNSESQYRMEVQYGGVLSSVQRLCEVAVLLLIVAAFVIVGVLCARLVSSRLLAVEATSAAAATGRALRLQMAATTAFVFVAFLLRSVFSVMSAVAHEFRDFGKVCGGGLCDALCHNVYTHIAQWMGFTPEFEITIVFISSPVTLLVALWGMTSKSTRQLMKLSEQERPMSVSLVPSSPARSFV